MPDHSYDCSVENGLPFQDPEIGDDSAHQGALLAKSGGVFPEYKHS